MRNYIVFCFLLLILGCGEDKNIPDKYYYTFNITHTNGDVTLLEGIDDWYRYGKSRERFTFNSHPWTILRVLDTAGSHSDFYLHDIRVYGWTIRTLKDTATITDEPRVMDDSEGGK